MPYIILGAFLFSLLSGIGGYLTGRSDGSAACHAKWEMDKAQQAAKRAELVLIQQAASDKIAAKLETEKLALAAQGRVLDEKLTLALGDLSRLRLGRDLARLHNANVSSGPPRAASEDSPPTPEAAPRSPEDSGGGPTLGEFARVCEANVIRHNECVSQVLGWQEWFRSMQGSCK